MIQVSEVCKVGHFLHSHFRIIILHMLHHYRLRPTAHMQHWLRRELVTDLRQFSYYNKVNKELLCVTVTLDISTTTSLIYLTPDRCANGKVLNTQDQIFWNFHRILQGCLFAKYISTPWTSVSNFILKTRDRTHYPKTMKGCRRLLVPHEMKLELEPLSSRA